MKKMMNYFKLRPIIKKYKEQMFQKHGIIIKKVKWNKKQLDLMMKFVLKEEKKTYFKDCKSFKINNIKINERF